jgi:hypothetical protein
MGAQQRLEASPLVGMGKAEQHDGVLAHMGMDVEEDLAPEATERGQYGGRHRGPVADPLDLDDHLAG